jgi:hypothetical protein
MICLMPRSGYDPRKLEILKSEIQEILPDIRVHNGHGRYKSNLSLRENGTWHVLYWRPGGQDSIIFSQSAADYERMVAKRRRPKKRKSTTAQTINPPPKRQKAACEQESSSKTEDDEAQSNEFSSGDHFSATC